MLVGGASLVYAGHPYICIAAMTSADLVMKNGANIDQASKRAWTGLGRCGRCLGNRRETAIVWSRHRARAARGPREHPMMERAFVRRPGWHRRAAEILLKT